MGELGSLVLRIKADIDDLTTNLNKAAKNADGFGDSIGKVSKAGAAVLATLTTATIAAVKAGGEHAEQIEMVSQKTGIAKQVIQQWSVALAENNLTTDHLTTGMKQLSKMMVEAADPSSAAANMFEELNITGKTTDAVILQIADRFKAMPDGAEKARLAVELFGKSGLDMIPILNKGSEGFRESMNAAKRFAAVLSDTTLSALSQADDAFDRLGVATKSASYQFAGLMAPAVSSVTNALSDGIGWIGRYLQAMNEIKAEQANASSSWGRWGEILKGIIAPSLAIIPQRLGETIQKMDEIAKRTTEEGDLLDSHVKLYEQQGAEQERLGLLIRNQSIEEFQQLQAQGHAQEALGKTTLAIIQRETNERNAAFALQLQQQEEVNNLQFAPVTPSAAMKAQQEAVENLIRLMPELNHQEAAFLALKNAEDAHNTIRASIDAYRDRNKELELGVAYARADFQLQQAWYQQAPGLIDATNNVRMQGFAMIEAEGQLQRQIIDQTIFDEERKAAAILALDMDTMNKRRQIIQQFPTFWEQQLQAIVASNAFSLSTITSNFNNATAQWILGQGTFAQFWQQTQQTLLTSAMQFGEQWLAQLALGQLRELGMTETLEAAKTALVTAGILTRGAEEQAANKNSIASAGVAVSGIAAVGEAGLAAGLAVVEATVGIFAAIGSALAASIVGSPLAPAYFAAAGAVQGAGSAAIAAGQGVLAGAVASAGSVLSSALALADGGIVTSPTNAVIGEAGSPEAAIPLNDRGAAFMQKTLGLGGGGGVVIIRNELNGRVLSEEVMRNMPGVYRLKMGNR